MNVVYKSEGNHACEKASMKISGSTQKHSVAIPLDTHGCGRSSNPLEYRCKHQDKGIISESFLVMWDL